MVAVEPEVEPVIVEPEPEVEAEPEPMVAVEPEVEAEPEPEPMVAVEPEPEPMVAVEPEPEPMVAVEPEPVIVEREPLPRILPVSETVLQIPKMEPSQPELRVAASAGAEADAGGRARRSQLDLLGLGEAGGDSVAPERPKVLPYRSSGAAGHAKEAAPDVAGARGAFWDASAREVSDAITGIGVQNCGTCGLSLSASARFCRRCGTPQARSA
jgi:ribosomal protein L40E/outer membrane biosynthesis protein TonB